MGPGPQNDSCQVNGGSVVLVQAGQEVVVGGQIVRAQWADPSQELEEPSQRESGRCRHSRVAEQRECCGRDDSIGTCVE